MKTILLTLLAGELFSFSNIFCDCVLVARDMIAVRMDKDDDDNDNDEVCVGLKSSSGCVMH